MVVALKIPNVRFRRTGAMTFKPPGQAQWVRGLVLSLYHQPPMMLNDAITIC